jgi:hypothetical protein
MTEPPVPPAQPKPIVPSDDLEDVITAWGVLPKWKARALALGEMQAVLNEHARADALTRTPLHDEDKPPRPVADTEETRSAIPPELMQAIEDRIEQLTQRLDAFERMKKAEDALTELEDRVDAEIAEREARDDGDLLLKHIGDDGRTLN